MEKRIYISIALKGLGFVPAGIIIFNENSGYAGFVYYNSYIKNGYPVLNPATLNYKTSKTSQFPVDTTKNPEMLDRTFWELLPSQTDFGSSVLISRNPEYFTMNNAQKLYFLGSRIVGGFSCYIDKQKPESNIVGLDWLDEIRKESVEFYLKQISSIKHIAAIDPLTTYGGVRPKTMFKDENGEYWIAKFNLPNDPYNMAKVEHMAALMAKDCGLDFPETKYLTLQSGEDVFLTKRFDRDKEHRRHGVSLFAMAPAIEYERIKLSNGNFHSADVMGKLVNRFSENKMDNHMLAKKLIVDIGFNNTDNHLRNSRFILNDNNEWNLSPSFDILFDPRNKPHTYNPSGLVRQETYLNNEKIIHNISNFTQVEEEDINKYINNTKSVIQNIQHYANLCDINETDFHKIQNAVSIGMMGPELLFKFEQMKRNKFERKI